MTDLSVSVVKALFCFFYTSQTSIVVGPVEILCIAGAGFSTAAVVGTADFFRLVNTFICLIDAQVVDTLSPTAAFSRNGEFQ